MGQDMMPDMMAFAGIIMGLFLLTSLGAGLHYLIKKSTQQDTPKITHDSPHTQPPHSAANSSELEHLNPYHHFREKDEEWRDNYYGSSEGKKH